MGKYVVLQQPLLTHKLTIIRDKNTDNATFRRVVDEITELMVYEVTRDLPLENVALETPIGKTVQPKLAGKAPVIVPVLRAGLGMLNGFLHMMPEAEVGYIGMSRNEETLEAHEYFVRVPQDIAERKCFIVDPMLATGGSIIDAIGALIKRGVPEKAIRVASIVAAPDGIKAVQAKYPAVDLYVAVEDEKLMPNGYIYPGLGDAGDRLNGTVQSD
jgi:uracil phosphoribosyltransferase